MTKHYIYEIRNKVTKKYYVGRTCELKKRFGRHLRELRNGKHHCLYLQRVWDKYGEHNFEFSIIESDLNEDEAIKREQDYLDNKRGEIYNVSFQATGGDMITNHPMRQEIIKKMISSNRKRYESMTQKEKKEIYGQKGRNNPMFGKKHSLEAIDKIKKKNKEYYEKHEGYRKNKTFEELFGEEKAKEMKKKLSKVASERTNEKNPFYGRIHTEDSKKKIAKANKGKKPVNQKPVIIDQIEYPSATEASRQLKVVPATILHRIKSKNPKYDGYFYKAEMHSVF